MSRVVLIAETGPVRGFAHLRARHFAAGLAEEHEVHLVDCRADVRAALDAVRPDAVVTAGNYAPTRAAVAAVRDEPLWVDLPGDPFAEAQAAAAFAERPQAVAAEAAAVFLPALARGDAFSSVCGAGRAAVLGALGAVGRVARLPLEDDAVHVVPNAAEFGLPPGRPRRPGSRVALLGSFNHWFDVETLLAGLLTAMDAAPVTVVCAGGAVDGHHEATFARFRAGATASRHAARFDFRGWVDHDALPALLADAHVGIVLDRDGVEPELGSRTRVLLLLQQGLRVIASPRTELVRALCAQGLATPVRAGDAAAVATALLHPRPAPDARAFLGALTPYRVTEPLRAWARAPRRLPPSPDADALRTLSRERDAARGELADVRASPTWRLLDRLRRLVR